MQSTMSSVSWFTLESILVSLLWFLLWNIKEYLASKPPNQQTLLDGANNQLFDYIGLLNLLFITISICYEISNHQVNPGLAYILASIVLWMIQIFCYQILICAIIRLGIVLGFELPLEWSDDLVHRRIRITLAALAIFIVILVSADFDFESPFAKVLQGNDFILEGLEVQIQPFLWALAFLVQFVSRIIVRFKVGFGNNEGPSKELINTKTFLLMISCFIIMRILIHFGAIASFQTSFMLVHCICIVVALQIIHHSQSLWQRFTQKFHVIGDLSLRMNTLIDHLHAPRWRQNSIDPIHSVCV